MLTIESISRMLAGSKAFDAIAVCGLNNSRATGVDKLARIFEDSIADAHSRIALTVYKDAESAYEGEKKSMSDDDKLYICGSLYLIADIREYTEAGKDDQF